MTDTCTRPTPRRRHRAWVFATFLAASVPLAVRGQDDQSRSIVPEAFLKARPAAPAGVVKGGATYRRVGRSRQPAVPANVSEIGITIWRLRPTAATDTARLLVQEPQGPATQLTPERVEAGAALAVGDRVRISVESPRNGYLYVIDREVYADGSTGDPYLIFPTTRARGGDNRVTGGRLVEIPAQTDAPPYFTLQASRPNQVSEHITVLIAQEPLPEVTPGPAAVLMSREAVAAWTKRGGALIDQLEMVGGAGRPWSAEEQRAGADATRLLTQQDPPPQTLFRVVTTDPAFVAAQFTLSHARARAVPGGTPR